MIRSLKLLAGAVLLSSGISAQSMYDEDATRNWLRLRCSFGLVGNESYTDVPFKNPDPSHFDHESYNPIGPVTNRIGYTVGVQAILGPNEYIKHVVGVSYINSYTEYRHTKSDWSYSAKSNTSNTTDLAYEQQTNYLNLNYHFGVHINTHFSIEPGLMLVASLRSPRYKTGYIRHYSSTQVYNPSTNGYDNVVNDQVQTFDHEKEKASPGTVAALVTLRLNCDLTRRYGMGIPLGIYAEGSIGFTRRIGWVSAGINYYPFRKLR